MKYLHDRNTTETAQLMVFNDPIMITGNYKGISLTHPAEVLNIIPGRAILQAPDPKLCLALEEKINLYSRESGQIVSARVSSLDMVERTLDLVDLTYSDRYWNEHRSDRVQPLQPIDVEGEYKNKRIHAKLKNLSVGGMSLMVHTGMVKALHIYYYSVLHLTLRLPNDNERLFLKGKIVHARQSGMQDIIGIKLLTTKAQERQINRYVTARKAVILAELEQDYRALLEQQRIPDLLQ